MSQTVQSERQARYARLIPLLGITEVAQEMFYDSLADFFQAVSEYAAIVHQQGWDTVMPYTGKYATLRGWMQNGLLTEREYSLIEEGRNI